MKRILLGMACAAFLGCAEPWQPPGLEPHREALAARPDHRLRDATPYLLPVRGELIEFFCRWPSNEPVRIALPGDATPDERRALEAAVEAWQGLDLGIALAVAEPAGPAEITVEFLAPESTSRAEGTGYTLADCRLEETGAEALRGAVLPAHLERARIRIVRRETDEWDAADHAWFAGEVAGVALHELAHALGFQGHARFGGGILAQSTKESTKVGRALLAGAAFDEPTLRALYALPSGVVLARTPIPHPRTAALDAWWVRAARQEGPFIRVGDRTGRIFWRFEGDKEAGVTLASITTARSKPERLVLLSDPRPR